MHLLLSYQGHSKSISTAYCDGGRHRAWHSCRWRPTFGWSTSSLPSGVLQIRHLRARSLEAYLSSSPSVLCCLQQPPTMHQQYRQYPADHWQHNQSQIIEAPNVSFFWQNAVNPGSPMSLVNENPPHCRNSASASDTLVHASLYVLSSQNGI